MKKFLTLILTLVMIGSAVGCQKEPVTETNAELENFDVVLDWYPNAVHAFIYEAIAKGYYVEEGLNVNIRFPSNINDSISMPAAGKADLGIYYLQDTLIAKINEDIPVKSVGAILQSPLSVVLSLKEKNIKSPKDLEGKTVGYSNPDLGDAIIKTGMKAEGADSESVKFLDVGFDLMSAMTTGNVDATMGCMLNHEVPQMEKEGLEVNYYFSHDYGVPKSYELVFLAGDKLLEENPEKIERFLRATKKGFDDMKANPNEAIQILLENQNAENFPLTESVEKQSMDIILPFMETEDVPFLTQTEEVWQENIDWLFEQGLITKKIEAKDIMADVFKK